MIEFIRTHLGVISVVVAFMALIALAVIYGKSGGILDTIFKNIFNSVSAFGTNAINSVNP